MTCTRVLLDGGNSVLVHESPTEVAEARVESLYGVTKTASDRWVRLTKWPGQIPDSVLLDPQIIQGAVADER